MPKSNARVLTVAPMPPEKLAYALARYSRSPDSIRESIEWVRSHDSSKFLESFYFAYGHGSIADLGHVAVCFEGISEAAAIEIEDEQLWDGQARSSRYQDFSKAEVIVPPELSFEEAQLYRSATGTLLKTYGTVHQQTYKHLEESLPRPSEMKPEVYARNLNARAFDVARYLLPLGIPTGVGQITSIRTLERQIARLGASPFEEVREIASELTRACSEAPSCRWNNEGESEPVAPTLARHVERDIFGQQLRADLAAWAAHHLPPAATEECPDVDLLRPADPVCDICASLLYPVADRPYRELYRIASEWPASRRSDLLNEALRGRGRRDQLPSHFRSAPFVFDFVMDIGSFRDFHRHRRCQQLRQNYTHRLGFATPDSLEDSGASADYQQALKAVEHAVSNLPQPAAQYLLPFATRSRFLFKMDFAELEYISRLRSGVKGHIAYRRIAWEMKLALQRLEPTLGELIDATPPDVMDPLRR